MEMSGIWWNSFILPSCTTKIDSLQNYCSQTNPNQIQIKLENKDYLFSR